MGGKSIWSCWCWRRHRPAQRSFEAVATELAPHTSDTPASCAGAARDASEPEAGQTRQPLLDATSIAPQATVHTNLSADLDSPTEVPTHVTEMVGALPPLPLTKSPTLPRISPEQQAAARLSAALMAGAAVRASVAAASAVQEDFAGDLASSAPRSVAGMRCRSAAAAAVR